ncbi:MAG TPA: hypothetical protein VGM73_06810 [Candidatus Didemnitutus sp.]|jgi:2-polyprenyl-3-methyl-5-hydroxy-6-metoxy-1,4-benzoquinol methylase
MQRQVQPEILDTLSPDHPDALHNRRDLRVTNRLMGNHRWVERTLLAQRRAGDRILEIGAGAGELGARLAACGLECDGLDLWPRPPHWPVAAAWHRVDLLEFDRYQDYDVIIGNLIFHQFAAADLAALGHKLRSRARVIVACEPTRRRMSQVMFARVAPLLGANYVSMHDAHVSIAAGFRASELPEVLGVAPDAWDVRCTETSLGACRMVAVRRP